jgi:hypothetical protein
VSWLDRLFRRLPVPAWSPDGQGLLAFAIGCDGTLLTWSVTDGVLTLSPTGGTAQPASIALAGVATIAALVTQLGGTPGYLVTSGAGAPYNLLAALALQNGSGTTADTNGGNILLATSPQYQVLQAIGAELAAAEAQIPELPPQMSTTSAVGPWLDYLGGFFAVPRVTGERDALYSVRIIQETIRPKTNNTSMARALTAYTGASAQVTDAVNYVGEPNLLNASFALDGSHTLSGGIFVTVGGFFDVEAGYDLVPGDFPPNLAAELTAYINRLKAGGTQLRNLTLAPLSGLSDQAPVPSDTADSLSISYSNTLDGSYLLNGHIILSGGLTITGRLSGP